MKTKPLPLWKIYVPSLDKDGREFPVSKHKVWDAAVCKMTGGMTLMRREEGKWVDPSGNVMAEPMIPVLLACTRKQLFEVIRYTLSYYEQQAIMASKVTDEVWIVSEKDFDTQYYVIAEKGFDETLLPAKPRLLENRSSALSCARTVLCMPEWANHHVILALFETPDLNKALVNDLMGVAPSSRYTIIYAKPAEAL